MSRLRSILVLSVVVASLAVTAATQASPATATKLFGQSGPGYTITLKSSSHKPVRSLKAGSYTFEIQDRATSHNFHLVGPGVNKKTGVNFLGGQVWKLKLSKGTYQYYCDVHRSSMHRSFKVT